MKLNLLIYILLLNFICSICQAKPISLKNANDINFGDIFFLPNNNGTISIGTNGNVTYSLGFSHKNGITQAGYIDIQGDVGKTVNVSCAQNSIISSGFAMLEIQNIEISPNLYGTGNYGSRYACNGLGNASTSFTIQENSMDNRIYIGGQINILSSAHEGEYNSSNIGGIANIINVEYQD